MPNAEGGHFPKTAKFAKLLVAQIDHKIRADVSSYERSAAHDGVVSVARGHALRSHDYTNDYLGGPKGCGGNPTPVYGVRLAQFDSDYGLGMMFCDVGIVDFWIDTNDLAAGRWDRAWAATAGG